MGLIKKCDKIKYKKKILSDPIRGLGKDKYERVGNETIFNMLKKLSNATSLYLYLKHNKSTWDKKKI